MSAHGTHGPGWNHWTFPSRQSLALGGLFFLPALSPQFFGWLNGLLAVPVFLLLTLHGRKTGVAQLVLSLAMAGGGALLVQRFEVFLFSLTMVPLGFMLAASAQAGESAARSGGKGLATLGLTWLAFWSLFGALAGTNPYGYLLRVLDTVLQQTVELYRSQGAAVTPEVLYSLEQVTGAMRQVIPVLMPGILASLVIVTVWLSMVAANSLSARILGASGPWGRYTDWRLPEQMVWAPIAGITALLIGTGTLKHAGIWLLMTSGLLYCQQGLAVLLSLLDRWNVPVFFRIMLYFFCLIQSYSIILLALLGMSDVWFSLRQETKPQDNG